MRKKWNKRAPLFILFAVAGVFAMGALTMVLWNGIIPAIFHLGTITLLQGVGLMGLSRLLFGGFKRGGGRGRHFRGHCGERGRGRWQGTPQEAA